MKRFIATSLIIGVSTFGLVGCDEKSESTTKQEVKTPNGSETKTIKVEDAKSGDMKDSEKDKDKATSTTTTTETPK